MGAKGFTNGGKRPGAGKPKGYKAPHTLEAQTQRAKAIALVEKNLEAIFLPQIKKAKEGDTAAFNAVLDRSWGKAPQSVEMSGKDGKDLPQPLLYVLYNNGNSQIIETQEED